MRLSISTEHPLHRYFSGLVQQAMYTDAGVCDVDVVDYLSELLVEFIHTDRIFRLQDESGRPLQQVAEMLERTLAPAGATAPPREVHRHIGDFTLFWMGLYPENLRRLCARDRKDYLIDYPRQGKRSYAVASDMSKADERPPAALLRRLSECYESCVHGLGVVREQVRLAQLDNPASRLLK